MNGYFTHITKALTSNDRSIGVIEVYAFGSAVYSSKRPSDIDVLIIYTDSTQPKKIRHLLGSIDFMPLHLTFMFREEENETDFISRQNVLKFLKSQQAIEFQIN